MLAKFFFFFCAFADRNEVEDHKKKPGKERHQYPAILTEQSWSIKDLLYGQTHQRISLLREQSGQSRATYLVHLARSGSQSEHRTRFILHAREASHTIRERNNLINVCEDAMKVVLFICRSCCLPSCLTTLITSEQIALRPIMKRN